MKLKKEEKEELSKNFSLEKVKQFCLSEKCAFIEYYLGDLCSLGIIISKDDFKIIKLPPKKQIEKLILGYIKLISNKPLKNINWIIAGNKIYENIFEPLEKYVPNSIENLVIIPDDCLYYLPFEVLTKKVPMNKEKYKYLLEKYNMTYIPSVSAFFILKERAKEELKNGKEILAIGSPKYNLYKIKSKEMSLNISEEYKKKYLYEDLPYAKKEIETIGSIFKNNKKDICVGKRASEKIIKNLLMNDYRIIHFACHGYIDESFPFRSSLVLTPEPEKGEDGFLEAHEISELDINAKLVVLSACQSARGPLEKAEGIMSLNRVFFTSGAKAVISSLWHVNDRSSAELMKYFYKQLKRGVSIARALREAKLNMLKTRFNHPFYWAGFILSGDGFSILFDQN